MSREVLNLRQAAEHVHLEMNELKHVAQRGEIEAVERGGEWYFEHRVLDEWAQRNLLSLGRRELGAQHRSMMDEQRRERREERAVADYFRPGAIELSITAKAKAGIIRDMTDLAERTGAVYDPEALFKELVAREEAASTAIGRGMALLHPRFHDPYLFEESFIAYGRSARPIFFGARDGEATRHFFLVCCTDHELHLHLLARLAVMAHGTDFLEKLDAAADADEVVAAVRESEKEYQ